MLANFIYILRSKALISVITILYTALLVRLLTSQQFAVVALFEMLLLLTNTISSLGLESLLIKRLPALVEQRKSKTILKLGCVVIQQRLVFSGLFLLIVYIFSEPLLNKFALTIDQFDFFMFSILCLTLVNSLTIYFQATLQVKLISSIEIFYNFTSKIIILAMLYMYGFDGFLIGLSATALFYLLILYIKSNLSLFERFSFKRRKVLLKSSIPLYFSGLTRFFILQGDQLIIASFFSPHSMAVYALAKKMIGYLKVIIDSLSTPFILKLNQCSNQKTLQGLYCAKGFQSYIYILLPLLIGLSINSELAFSLMGGDKYNDDFSVLFFLAIANLLFVINTFLSNAIFSRLSTFLYFKIDSVSNIIGFSVSSMALFYFHEERLGLNQLLSYSSITVSLFFLACFFGKDKIFPVLFNSTMKILSLNLLFLFAGLMLSNMFSVFEMLFVTVSFVPLYLIYLKFDSDLLVFIKRGFKIE
ncbi:oligosaccharide flippase family protein [Vibrio splendidus]|uniref:oligosaccharide flippase family protein n=2 Tax=Vibrio splendidus TaxID=29497 RepID=UPI0006CA2D8A|nr:oligosaccharide flippase family protein [Vibrio splendidus]KPL96803.1 hypothetical protein AN167_25730 [Vibrio splendidus]PTO78722.1 hypothetical protein CWN84_05600 [Vibrio splendidus]